MDSWFTATRIAAAGSMAAWSALTIAIYVASKQFHHRFTRLWTAPIILTPLLLIFAMFAMGSHYSEYIRGTHWLLVLLGPATVAFAVPIYSRREMIRRHWQTLTVGVLVGSSTAMVTSYGLATALGLSGSLRLSLLPRSISTPFAMNVSGQIGGVPELTALFVILTGVFGATIGENLLRRLPVRSAMARGALFGMGAHAVGSNRAYQIDNEAGAVAGVMMILVGIANVLAAPALAQILRSVP